MKQQQQQKKKKKKEKRETRKYISNQLATGSAFISDYVIVNKTAFMIVCNITLMMFIT